MPNSLSFKLTMLALAGSLLIGTCACNAQSIAASPTTMNPPDPRFQGMREDWTSPALGSGQLKAVQPLAGFVDDHPRYTVELLQVQWRASDPIDLYVMKPKGVSKTPVILYLYGYPTDTDIFKNDDYDALVTRDGFAAVGFVSALTGHRYRNRPMKEWFLSELQESVATSAHDVQMVLNYLASRGDLDMNRVGMFAQGSGASIAILASAVDPRIKVLDALDPWGDWPAWLATSPFVPEDERQNYVTPGFLKKTAPIDPLVWLPKLQARKFRLDQQLFDTNTPTPVKEKLRAATPAAATTVMLYKNIEEFKTEFRDGKNLRWIQHQLESIATEGK